MKHGRKRNQMMHRARPAAAPAEGTDKNDREESTMKNTEEFDAYKDFIIRLLDRCDLRMIKIIYEFVFAMVK